MIWLFALAIAQSNDFLALDQAHEAWMRCVVSAAQERAASSPDLAAVRESAYRACIRQEDELRRVLAALNPNESPEAVSDIISQFKQRSSYLVSAAISSARRH